jgi:hypothetical protein
MKSAERCTAVQRVEAAFVSKWQNAVEKGIFEDVPLEVVDCLYLALAASKKSDGQGSSQTPTGPVAHLSVPSRI